MNVVFKTSTLDSPLELFTGQNINAYNSSLKKLIIKRVRLCASSDTFLNVYIQARDVSDNSLITRYFAKSTPVMSGDNVELFMERISVTNEYSIFISKTEGDSAVVDVYFEYEEVDDNPFVNNYLI
tara:strand:+ start:526 stop:903 length:378 start_codon:yes stop_codon:yes gene_type:complete